MLRGQCNVGSRCWNHHPTDDEQARRNVAESNNDDARSTYSQNNNEFETAEEAFDDRNVTLLTHAVQLTEKVFGHIAMKTLSVMRAVNNITCIATMATAPSSLRVIITTLTMAAGMAINTDLNIA